MMTQGEFITRATLALYQNTTYATGAFGASIGNFPAQLTRYCKNSPDLEKTIRARAANPPCFAFDCVGLVKGILWGWNAKADSVYGGAAYESNGVPDMGTETIINKCDGVSTDFSKIEVGELLWIKGHVGIYIGNGSAIECTSAWDAKVQKTAVTNIRKATAGEHGRKWTKHGKLPYVEYKRKEYEIRIGTYTELSDAQKLRDALHILGTDSRIIEV